MTNPAIEVNSVSLSLDSYCVFDDLSLTLAGGKFHCVLGRSGVGKSCLLRLISGLLKPDSGVVSVSSVEGAAGQVAHMFQDDGLLPWLSVLDNVQLGPRLRGKQDVTSEAYAKHLLMRVGLSDWAARYPVSLSGGMRQRVALARTLMEERPIILMDEPFSKLDAITRGELHELCFDLLKHRTVVMVTHDPAEALRLSHSITVLHASQPSSTSVFNLSSEPLRAYDDKELLLLQADLWMQLARDAARHADAMYD